MTFVYVDFDLLSLTYFSFQWEAARMSAGLASQHFLFAKES